MIDVDGALLLDKAVGLSSNRALQEARKLFAASKAGHAGTLDPLASGLLLVLFGEATKFAGPMLEADKEYLASVKLGETTSTGDAEGAILESRPVQVTDRAIAEVLQRFRGVIAQLPPMHSALKHEGEPLYKLARRGETVERQVRRVEIFELEMTGLRSPLLELRVRCSKGTYVRTLAQDIGAALGTGAHLAALRRTASGRFGITSSVSLQALEAMSESERARRLLPLSALLEGLPRAELDAEGEARLRNGQALSISGLTAGLCAVYRSDGGVIGLGRAEGSGTLRALRLTRGLTQAAEKHRQTL